jgi:2-keto-4-pentenoate hydratase/2-oxohepta-3-ene-1,7-dioic acid hydratase in catechol pathway
VKIARWMQAGVIGEGIVRDGRVIEFPDGLVVADVLRLGLQRALEFSGLEGGIALEDVQLLPPVVPPSIRDFVAFEEHVEGVVKSVDNTEGVVAEWYEFPTFYFTNPHSVIATGDVVVPPLATHRLDFELEVGAVIGYVDGSAGASLTPDEAHAHIFGYTIFNDWSARDVQSREMKVRLGPSKGKDFASTLGPWIVTADEFESLHDDEGFLPLDMRVEVNGVEYGQDLMSNMGWPFRELIAYASRDSRVVPGDVLGSGTCGRGCLAELWGRAGGLTPPPLQTGDEVVLRVGGIGEIRNVVAAARETPFIPAARVRPRNRD